MCIFIITATKTRAVHAYRQTFYGLYIV